jgi:aspartyl protease family protein
MWSILRRRRGFQLLLLLLVAGCLFVLVVDQTSLEARRLDREYFIRGLLGVAALFLAIFLGGRRAATFSYARGVLIVMIVLLVGFEAYLLRTEAQRLGDRLIVAAQPERAAEFGPQTVSIKASFDDHYYVDAQVNGSVVRFLVDTGATRVVLTKKEATRLGLDVAKLDYTIRFSTANGTVMGAPLTLREIGVGPILVHDVDAAVTENELDDMPVLGMSFLGLLDRYVVEGRTLTMTGRGR